MKLSSDHTRLLLAVAAGHALKAHRHLDGRKEFRLHYADGRASEAVERRLADDLTEAGLLDSNKKFPAATFWLTEAGRRQSAAADDHG